MYLSVLYDLGAELSCIDTFCNGQVSGVDLQRLVDASHPNFVCENECCSPFSHGPVENTEVIGFLLINPLHYDEIRGVIVPEAFQELTSRDLSTLRVRFASVNEVTSVRDELIQRGLSRIPPKMRVVDQVCCVEVMSIRSAKDQNGRIFAVYDTALERVRGHASVFVRPDFLIDKLQRKRVRFLIHEIFTRDVILFDEFLRKLSS